MMTARYVHIALEIWGSIFCLIAAMSAYIGRASDSESRLRLMLLQLCNALLLIFDAFAWFFRGNATEVGYYMVRGSNFLVFVLSYFILMLYISYCWISLPKEYQGKVRIRRGIVFVLCIMACIVIVISQFTDLFYYFDDHNFYHRTKWFPVTQISGIIGSGLSLSILLQYQKQLGKRFLPLMLYVFLPTCALFIQIFFYGISFLNIAITISVLLMFVEFQREQAQLVIQKERKLDELKLDIALSQIGSHFIFNTLTTIKYLCRNEPEAMNAVDEFAKYLRGNLDGIAIKECISMEEELTHVKNYVLLEQRRFGSRLQVEYHMDQMDFRLPALTLQPLVENAVKHGITKKAEGGRIIISTKETEEYYQVQVEDDGVGFDEKAIYNDGKNHIGISNVRRRLAQMCQGKLVVESTPGKGTSVAMLIPKKKNQRD